MTGFFFLRSKNYRSDSLYLNGYLRRDYTTFSSYFRVKLAETLYKSTLRTSIISEFFKVSIFFYRVSLKLQKKRKTLNLILRYLFFFPKFYRYSILFRSVWCPKYNNHHPMPQNVSKLNINVQIIDDLLFAPLIPFIVCIGFFPS